MSDHDQESVALLREIRDLLQQNVRINERNTLKNQKTTRLMYWVLYPILILFALLAIINFLASLVSIPPAP